MRHFLFGASCLVLSLPASAATIDFSGDACVGSCSNSAAISQDHGDIAGQLDVTYDGDASTTGTIEPMFWWESGYVGLTGVGYSQGQLLGLSILFDALAGYGVVLEEFAISTYLSRATTTTVKITDLGTGSVLLDSSPFAPSTAAPTSFSGSYASESALLLEFGPDAWDVGIDNITYRTYALEGEPPPPVPLPGSALALAGGLGLLGAMRQRRPRRSAR